MYPVSITKKRATELATALRDGSEITAPAAGWTFNELMTLAAACRNRVHDWGRDDDLDYVSDFFSNMIDEWTASKPNWRVGDVIHCTVKRGRKLRRGKRDRWKSQAGRRSRRRSPELHVIVGVEPLNPIEVTPASELRRKAPREATAIRRKLIELRQWPAIGDILGSIAQADLNEQIESLSAILADYESDLEKGGAV